MKKIFIDINRILADWDPIGVPKYIAIDEYIRYIPLILESIESREQLLKCLEDILINKLELGYNPANNEHSKDLQQVCDKLIEVYNR